jgi:hypothetical protein
MKKLRCVMLACVVALGFAVGASAQQEDFAAGLDGLWKSDWELTKQHIDADCKLNDDALRLLEGLMGKMTAEYSAKRVKLSMPEIRLKGKDGKELVLEGWQSEEELHVVARTKTQIALLEKLEEPFNVECIELITFEDADTYWVYLGDSPLAGHHVREYFRRVPNKQSPDAKGP